MSEVELLELGRSTTEHIANMFGQVITINFAMVVAIYYFLNRAPLVMKIFAYLVYLIGTGLFLGLMLQESNIKAAVLQALNALPAASLSLPTQRFMLVATNFLGVGTSLFENAAYWILCLGNFFLLFFWKKPAHEASH